MFDLDKMIDEQNNGTLAVAKVSNVFLEGLHDHLALPEAHSEAAEATHHLLGCEMWTAMHLLASLVHDIKGLPSPVSAYLDRILREHVTHHAMHVVMARGPIGEQHCGGDYNHGI